MQLFLFELEKICEELNHGNIRKIINEWTRKSLTIRKKVDVFTSSGKISGNAIRIDDDGALVISHAGKTQRVLVGDVV
jgi:BirA family biotin operon repressor/biotin-[acetyl-CoA-carboxylase] ligase